MTRVNAYILAADPVWIEASVLSYYDAIDTLVVSYDQSRRGWSGSPIAVDECIDRIRAIDVGKKVRLVPGDFARMSHSALENDTYQRQCALEAASSNGDWVLQMDTDEIIPRFATFVNRLDHEIPADCEAVDWPMRSFFHRTWNGMLEVCGITGRQISSFPGPIAVRAHTRLSLARQVEGRRWRYDIRPNDTDPAAGDRRVDATIDPEEAVIHLSWIRSEEEIRRKLESWGHSTDFDWRRYLEKVWMRAPKWWRWMFRLHPICPRWWPALRRVPLDLMPAGVR